MSVPSVDFLCVPECSGKRNQTCVTDRVVNAYFDSTEDGGQECVLNRVLAMQDPKKALLGDGEDEGLKKKIQVVQVDVDSSRRNALAGTKITHTHPEKEDTEENRLEV